MSQLIRDFLADIDRGWRLEPGRPVTLSMIGSSALLLQARYDRGTKDSDIFQTAELTSEVKQELLGLAGPGSALHRKWRLYIEIVGNGLPFLPQVPRWHSLPSLDASLRHLRIRVLDVVDVVVSKLARFEANDQADIDAMVTLGHVPHAALIERFRSAVYMFEMDGTCSVWTRRRSSSRRGSSRRGLAYPRGMSAETDVSAEEDPRERIADLEIKLAFQDRLIGELDALVRSFGERLDAMDRELKQLKAAVGSPELPLGPPAEPPPHY